MKKPTRKQLFSILFFFGIMLLTFWYVFHDENITQVQQYLSDANLWFVIPAVGAVIAFILGESVIIYYLLHKLGAEPSFRHCSLFSFIGFFYSAITPSASGGQPMQVVVMRRDGIPAAVSTVVLAIVTVTYKLVLVLLGIAVLVFRPDSIMRHLDGVEPLMYLGLVLNVAAIAFLVTAVFHPNAARSFLYWLLRVGRRFHLFPNPERASAKVEETILSYSSAAAFFKNNPRIIVHVFFITLVQRFCLFSVIWFTYLAFGLSGESAFVTVMLYAMISVAVDMLPLPGGMGISETLFLAIFETIFGEALVLPAMIVCRGISYYTQLLISAVMTGIAQFIFREKKPKKKLHTHQ